MPRFDKTGPEGKGQRTGRGMGKCDDSISRENQTNWFGRFAGRRHRRRGFWNKDRHSVGNAEE